MVAGSVHAGNAEGVCQFEPGVVATPGPGISNDCNAESVVLDYEIMRIRNLGEWNQFANAFSV
jgi:hypothetical protein